MAIKTMRGKSIDLSQIKEKQGTKVAVGNLKMNGFGDVLNDTGHVVKSHTQVIAEYNQAPQKAVKNVSLHELAVGDNQIMTPQEAAKALPAKERKRRITDSD